MHWLRSPSTNIVYLNNDPNPIGARELLSLPQLFRHTHATELIRNGWDAAWVQKRLGHANVQTTIDTYTHIDQQDLKKAFKLYQKNKKEGVL